MEEACNICFPDAVDFSPRSKKIIQSATQAINKRYQTKTDSFNVISLPNTPVKPARNTAICNWRKAFFMGGKERLFSFDHHILREMIYRTGNRCVFNSSAVTPEK